MKMYVYNVTDNVINFSSSGLCARGYVYMSNPDNDEGPV